METINWIQFGMTCAAFLAAMIGGTVAVTREFGKSMAMLTDNINTLEKNAAQARADLKSNFESKLMMFERDNEDKHKRIYGRFDEYKEHLEESLLPKYVSKEIWVIQFATIEKALADMSAELKATNAKSDQLQSLVMKLVLQTEQRNNVK